MLQVVLLTLAAPAPPVTATAFAPGGKEVVTGSQAGLEVRPWPALAPARAVKTTLAHIHDLAFSPAGDVLAVAGGAPGDEGAVELLRWPSGVPLRRVVGHTDLATAVAWRPDGAAWASAGADGICRVHDTATGKLLAEFKGHSRPVLALCFLPGGKAIVSAGVDQSLRLWDTATGKPVRAMDNHTAAVHALALRPTADPDALPMVASAGADRTVRLWQPTIGRMVRFARLPCSVLAVAWSTDGARLLAAGTDGKVRVIDPDSLAVPHTVDAVKGWLHTLAVPPAGDEVLAGGEAGRLARIRLPR